MRLVRSIAGDSVNDVLWRETQRDDDAAEEALWALNPGLASYGPLLPAGVSVKIPDLGKASQQSRKAVTAWD